MKANYQIVFKLKTVEAVQPALSLITFSGQTSCDVLSLIEECSANVSDMQFLVSSEIVSVNYSPVKNPFEDDEKKTE